MGQQKEAPPLSLSFSLIMFDQKRQLPRDDSKLSHLFLMFTMLLSTPDTASI